MKRFLWSLLLIVPLLFGLSRLKFDVEVLNLLPGDLPVVQGLRLEQEHFSTAHELIITLESGSADVTAAAAESLATQLRAATNLTEAVHWQPPWMEHPEEAAELAAYLWLNQPPEIFGTLTNQLVDPEAVLNDTRERLATSFSPVEIARLSRDPFGLTELPVGTDFQNLGQGKSFFSSEDGTFRAVIVKPRGELPGYRECASWLAKVRVVVAKWKREADPQSKVTVQFTGGPAFLGEISGSMEGDMKSSVAGTSLFVAALFWLAYRRFKPLAWLLCLLGLTLAVTLGIAGLVFGTINVISLGFAAILMGLSADYGVVLYEEARHATKDTLQAVRRHAARGIIGAALTTAAAFFALIFAGLPGLNQLGVLVAVGLLCGAAIMLAFYLPPLIPKGDSAESEPTSRLEASGGRTDLPGVLMTFVVLVAIGGVVVLGLPRVDHSSEPLRPRNSEAYAAAERIASKLQRAREPVWVIVTGDTAAVVAKRLSQVRVSLDQSVAQKHVSSFLLPDTIWPKPDNQAANAATLDWLVKREPTLVQQALKAGFNESALKLTQSMFALWRRAAKANDEVWPENAVSRWTFERFTARAGKQHIVAGVIDLAPGSAGTEDNFEQVQAQLAGEGVIVAGWGVLGEALLARVEGRLWLVLLPMALLVLALLWMTFRCALETALCLTVPLVGGICLLAVMRVLGWSWNLMNLTALPLLLGAGVDYGIHMQLALKRHGDASVARKTTGRALAVCAATTMAGFGSLAWSSNAGLASLGLVCATGIGLTFMASVLALPLWWRKLGGRVVKESRLDTPSSMYRGVAWQAGIALVRVMPGGVLDFLCRFGARIYWHLNGRRREVVIDNLLPVFDGDRSKANVAAKWMVSNFALKVADLWRFEAGVNVQSRFDTWEGWEVFQAAQARGKGVLMVTPHLGNWELGAIILIERGVKVLVLSDPEPDDRLTKIRQRARAAWGIETLIVGRDPFAVVEVIKRLQAGATVALLMDRPGDASAVDVELMGRPFKASIAAAELARASGCAIIPAFVTARGSAYESHIHPEVVYDRAALGNREARRAFTQEIMRAFETMIRQHPDQWYHFVPIWPRGE